ncbi:amp-binding enzyme [Lichtheimia corymbifera JMRC:FSU:9682]|uniref:Amp-binding enzyme n=1 Tax=Lichtheimia corymbifera JMRC:FSU:9682 TaxID=1263082 RepID=A0A068RIL0_9FUNG|nr:amp-binding enzyme [Lichtheimia corymbifera JMRC:FSU:9682]
MLGSQTDQPQNLYQLIFETKNPDQGFSDDVPLLIDAENTERYYTFNELRTNVRAFAHALLGPSLGVKQGDVIAICSRNDIEYYPAFHGIMAAGCVACPLRSFLSADDIFKIFQISDPKLVIAHTDTVQLMWDAMKLYGKQLPMLVMATKQAPAGTQLFTDFLQPVDEQQPLPEVSPDAPAHLLCTSGTTGAYKLVNGTHAVEMRRVKFVAEEADRELLGSSSALTVLTCGNFASAHNLIHSLQSWVYSRYRQYVTDSMDENVILHYVRKFKCATPNVLPCHVLTRLINLIQSIQQAGDETLDLSYLKMLCGAGQPLDPKVIERAAGIVPNTDVLVAFGSTECGYKFVRATNGAYQTYKGRYARENDERLEFKLVDENGKAVPRGSQGELLFKSPMIFKSYYNNPEKTAESFDEEGFFRTGDIFVMEEDERIRWLGRASERIKTYNKPVVPKPIEDLCMAFGGIRECAAVGAFSKKRVYELPRAYIVPEPGNNQDPEKLAEAVAQFVNERVPEKDSELTGGVKVISALPRTAVGKVNRFVLRQWAQDEVE